MNIRKNPYHLFLLASLFFVACSFFVNKGSIDIFTHDSYVIIAHQHWMWLWAIVFAFLFLVYRMVRKVLAFELLSWLHVSITLVFVILNFVPLSLFQPKPISKPFNSYQDLQRVWNAGDTVLLILLIGQLLFSFNIAWGIIKLISKKTRA